jgi:ABC-type transport system substrate-binding protein
MVLGGIFSEASGSQGFIFRCDSYEGGGNSVKYCNPRYDELDEQQRRELDPAKRRELQIELANIVWQDLPIGVLAFFDDTTGYSTRLHNLFPTGWGGAGWSLPWVWIDE